MESAVDPTDPNLFYPTANRPMADLKCMDARSVFQHFEKKKAAQVPTTKTVVTAPPEKAPVPNLASTSAPTFYRKQKLNKRGVGVHTLRCSTQVQIGSDVDASYWTGTTETVGDLTVYRPSINNGRLKVRDTDDPAIILDPVTRQSVSLPTGDIIYMSAKVCWNNNSAYSYSVGVTHEGHLQDIMHNSHFAQEDAITYGREQERNRVLSERNKREQERKAYLKYVRELQSFAEMPDEDIVVINRRTLHRLYERIEEKLAKFVNPETASDYFIDNQNIYIARRLLEQFAPELLVLAGSAHVGTLADLSLDIYCRNDRQFLQSDGMVGKSAANGDCLDLDVEFTYKWSYLGKVASAVNTGLALVESRLERAAEEEGNDEEAAEEEEAGEEDEGEDEEEMDEAGRNEDEDDEGGDNDEDEGDVDEGDDDED